MNICPNFGREVSVAFENLLIVRRSPAGRVLARVNGRGTRPMRLFDRLRNRGSRRAALAAVIIGVVFVGEAAAESAGSWYLVVPPLIPERQALLKAYTATSEADVKAAVAGLPEDQQVL